MLFKVLILLLALRFSVCGPHTHKNNAGSKEHVEHGYFVSRDTEHYKDGQHANEFDHESVLGSRNTAEEFDHLPPEEAKKRLFSLALKMDADGDKYVDKRELVTWILMAFKLLTEEEAMDDLENADGDEDGKVTWIEQVVETYGLRDNEMFLNPEEAAEELKMLEYDRELFNAADLNGDKVLDRSEYSSFSHPEEFEHMHKVVYDQAMKKHDTNKDGFLSFDEFVSDQPVPSTKQYTIEKDLFKNEYDLNGDNKLSKEEVLLWLIPNNDDTAENEANHLIEISDSDNDGKLSIEEIVDHHDFFVGSEATGFGEQLQIYKYSDEL